MIFNLETLYWNSKHVGRASLLVAAHEWLLAIQGQRLVQTGEMQAPAA